MVPPNLPQCGHFSSNKPHSCNGLIPSSLLGRHPVQVKAPECYSQGFRRGVPTVPRSLKVFFPATSLHQRRFAYWKYGSSLPPGRPFVKRKISPTPQIRLIFRQNSGRPAENDPVCAPITDNLRSPCRSPAAPAAMRTKTPAGAPAFL